MTIAEMNNQTEIERLTNAIFNITDNMKYSENVRTLKASQDTIEFLQECLLELINKDASYNPVPDKETTVFSTPEFVKELKAKAEYISKIYFKTDIRVKTGIEVLCYQIYHTWDGIVLDKPSFSGYNHFGNTFGWLKKKDLANILKENKVKGRSKCKTIEEMAKLCMSI